MHIWRIIIFYAFFKWSNNSYLLSLELSYYWEPLFTIHGNCYGLNFPFYYDSMCNLFSAISSPCSSLRCLVVMDGYWAIHPVRIVSNWQINNLHSKGLLFVHSVNLDYYFEMSDKMMAWCKWRWWNWRWQKNPYWH